MRYSRWRRLIPACCIAGAVTTVSFVQGCSKKEAVSEDINAQMKRSFKEPFDINKVPPKDRARVQGFMNMSKAGQQPKGTSASAPPGPTAR